MDDKERLIIVEKQTEMNLKKIEEHDEDIRELRKTYSIIETMALRVGNVEKTVESINEKLDKQGNKIIEESGKGNKTKADWFDYIIKGSITILIGYIAIRLGLK